jgi:hypothetical protein
MITHLEHRHRYKEDDALLSSSLSKQNQQQEQELFVKQRPVKKGTAIQEKSKYIKNPLKKNNYKPIIYTAIGIGVLCVIALAGFISGGCLFPNVNTDTVSLSPSSDMQLVLGDIYGHVSGPSGLPAIGATVIAAGQQTGHTVNSIISIDGNYNF